MADLCTENARRLCEASGRVYFPGSNCATGYCSFPQFAPDLTKQKSAGEFSVLAQGGISINGVPLGVTKLTGDLDEARRAVSRVPVGGFIGQATPYIVLAGQVINSVLLPGAAIAVSQVAQQLEQAGRTNMALNIGGLIAGIGTAIGGISNPIAQGLGTVAQVFGSALQPPSYPQAAPQQVNYLPAYSPAPVVSAQPQVVRTMAASGPALAYTGRMMASLTTPILMKIGGTIGKRLSLQGAVSMIRKMGKFLMSPESIAVALGISVAELAQLITASSAKKRRTMNPANPRALRRAARRIKSFHRMASHIDLLKGRGKSRRVFAGGGSCTSCKKNPCRC